ncbi:uncharacterized protein EI90DRAFT_2432871 [Cantharellus anzutake]|uniref:uncharacterized protein n=1 Tax=Cantharellus anzutake TaxID=1750568 RepID=UPI0019051F7D|nr:uncharacterized protein EI90DRAFT_2432871 [Cantharellus anzutake]KAF8338962.1 hypothetical protein EI90DRAFT_2432871 [Cantharellus anzutake]
MYRVTSLAESAEEMKDGPVLDLLSDRNNPLRTQNGWIEISKSKALVNASEAEDLKASAEWSPYFRLVLPNPLPNSIQSTAPTLVPPLVLQFPEPSPMFLPPPYTPSDSTFVHLSTCAQAVSDEARRKVQGEINDFAKKKFDEFKELDAKLRREVDLIWSYWRSGWLEHTNLSNHRGPDRSGMHRAPGLIPKINEFTEPSVHIDPRVLHATSATGLSKGVASSLLSDNLFSHLASMSSSLPQPSTTHRDSIQSTSTVPPPGVEAVGSAGSSSAVRPTDSRRKRLLPQDASNESRAVAASHQIRMFDNVSGSDTALLSLLGISTTNSAVLPDEAINSRLDEETPPPFLFRDNHRRPPLSKGESPRSHSPAVSRGDTKSPKAGEKKRVKFEATKEDDPVAMTSRSRSDNIESK